MKLSRSLLFDLCFYVYSPIYMLFFLPSLLGPRSFAFMVFRWWATSIMALLKLIVGLDFKTINIENLKSIQGPCILACKHQSAWETIIFAMILNDFAIVLKSQLMYIPLFNIYLKRLGSIAIDRNDGIKAIKQLLSKGNNAIKKGQSILIFPEGTRGIPGVTAVYQPGIDALYKSLNVPVIPVALNSGLFWGRRCFVKRSGTITLEFLPAIQPGLSRTEFSKDLEEKLEAACVPLNCCEQM